MLDTTEMLQAAIWSRRDTYEIIEEIHRQEEDWLEMCIAILIPELDPTDKESVRSAIRCLGLSLCKLPSEEFEEIYLVQEPWYKYSHGVTEIEYIANLTIKIIESRVIIESTIPEYTDEGELVRSVICCK